jgi:hypothetical protein
LTLRCNGKLPPNWIWKRTKNNLIWMKMKKNGLMWMPRIGRMRKFLPKGVLTEKPGG